LTAAVLKLPAANAPLDWGGIYDWATSENGGQLPGESARAFASWLDENWNEWTDDEESTVGSVLDGAVTEWCGGRTFG
jgi:hypothetical protein